VAAGPLGPRWAALVYMPSTSTASWGAELRAGVGPGGSGEVGQASLQLGPVVAGGPGGWLVSENSMEVNLFGAWRLTNALLLLLQRSEHPRVVNVSSGAGSHGDDQFGLTRRGGTAVSYGISKAALSALTSTLAAELADTPVLVNAVCPGLTATWPGAQSMGARPVADGAASILWAVTLSDDGPSGELRRDGQPLPW
jgi:NAD(P)-dependent dehydrogenase (short-subunit alcohol dehydrogenase family)